MGGFVNIKISIIKNDWYKLMTPHPPTHALSKNLYFQAVELLQ